MNLMAKRSWLFLVKKKINTKKYHQILELHLSLLMDLLEGPDFLFQQDGVSIHASNSAKIWFHQNNSKVMNSPTRNLILWRTFDII